MFLNGEAITDRDRRGRRITGDSLLLLFQRPARADRVDVAQAVGLWWDLIVDTAAPEREGTPGGSDQSLPVAARSVVVLMRRDAPADAGG